MKRIHIFFILLWFSASLFAFAKEAGGIPAGVWDWLNPLPQGNNSLYSVWSNGGSNTFAVGDAGTILYYGGTAWSTMDSGTATNLRAIYGNSGSDIFDTSSHDPDGSITGSYWPQFLGTPVAISNPTFSAPSAPVDGADLVFRLTVTGKGSLLSQDTCKIHINHAE